MASAGNVTTMAPEHVVPGTTVIGLINSDHRKFEALHKEYKEAPASEMKQKIAWTFIREVAMHSAAEEMVMYPEVRKRMGDAVADELLSGHQALKNKLQELNSTTREKDALAYDTAMDEAFNILSSHIKEEEGKDLKEFERLPDVDHELLVRLGEKFKASKHVAVTRPHPWAPNKPPLNVVANAMTAPLDALADQWRFAFNVPNPQA